MENRKLVSFRLRYFEIVEVEMSEEVGLMHLELKRGSGKEL